MQMIGTDGEGNLMLTYDVSVYCHGKTVFNLGTGMDAVFKFDAIVQAGIPEAKQIKYLWYNNSLVTIQGDALIRLINQHYKGLAKEAEKRIDPEEEYVIDCYDMS